MTLHQALVRLDELSHNTYSAAQKTAWLSQLDGRVSEKILATHEGQLQSFSGYDEKTAPDTVLLVPGPFDEIYIHYLQMQLSYHNGELDRYNNASALFQAAWDGFARHYNRTHLPRTQGWKFP